MNYYIDTEFHEYQKQSKVCGIKVGKPVDTIELISIGIVAEDGREYYAICNEFDLRAAWDNEWLKENVLKSIHAELNRKMGTYHRTYHYDTTNKFCYKHLKRLLRWAGKSKKEIAGEILEFIKNFKFDDVVEGGKRYDSRFGNGVNNTYYIVDDFGKSKEIIGTSKSTDPPKFYAYYADYDWVVLCWLFGRMVDLPEGFPMYCRDLKQMLDEIGNPNINHLRGDNEHNALDDAKFNRRLHEFLTLKYKQNER